MEYFDTDQITAQSVAVDDYYSRFSGEEIDSILASVNPHIGDTIIHVTVADRAAWNGKQPTITDLATIRNNASLGATAYGWGNHANAGYYVGTADTIKAIKVNSAASADSCSGNAASATKLQTTRKLWGQSFNGTADVNGKITVSNLTADGRYTEYGQSMICHFGSVGWAGGIQYNDQNNINVFALGYYKDNYFYFGHKASYDNPKNVILPNDNIGIGTVSPQYKLDVNGSIHGIFEAVGNKYFPNEYGIHMHNSDIVGINRLVFNDYAETSDEGISFYRSDGGYDNLYAQDGTLKFTGGAHFTGSVRIGGAVLEYDATNNALKVTGANGATMNLYTTGGISAYGYGASSGGGGGIDWGGVSGTGNVITDIKYDKGQLSATRGSIDLSSKQDAITDLSTIRNNASLGATAYGWGNHANAGYYVGTADTIKAIKVNNAVSADKLSYTGVATGVVSAAQLSGSYYNSANNVWASYLIFNHGDGSNYFHQMIRMPFFSGAPQYQRMVSGELSGWHTFITTENISSQSVASAARLKTPRQLWGNSFDGSADVNGSLEIKSTGGSWNEGIRMHAAENGWCGLIMCDSANTGSSGTTANTWSIHNHEGLFCINRNGSGNHTGYELVSKNGNWGVGTIDPQYKLDVNGSVRIGSAVLEYDSANKALKLRDSSGNPLNLYTTGGISAYGVASGGYDSIENLKVGALTVDALTVGGTEIKEVSKDGSYLRLTINGVKHRLYLYSG